MAPHHFASNRRIHLRDRFRSTFEFQATGDLVKSGFGENRGGPKQNSIGGLFAGEFRARLPISGSANRFGQDDLALGGEPCGFYGKTPVRLSHASLTSSKGGSP
jgi:hypothetical protein